MNSAKSTEVGAQYTFLQNTNYFYKYSHRGCETDDSIDVATADPKPGPLDCGSLSELSRFKVCPNWLRWAEWSDCYQDELVEEFSGGSPEGFKILALTTTLAGDLCFNFSDLSLV